MSQFILTGSRATGKFGAHSDWDVVVLDDELARVLPPISPADVRGGVSGYYERHRQWSELAWSLLGGDETCNKLRRGVIDAGLAPVGTPDEKIDLLLYVKPEILADVQYVHLRLTTHRAELDAYVDALRTAKDSGHEGIDDEAVMEAAQAGSKHGGTAALRVMLETLGIPVPTWWQQCWTLGAIPRRLFGKKLPNCKHLS